MLISTALQARDTQTHLGHLQGSITKIAQVIKQGHCGNALGYTTCERSQ